MQPTTKCAILAVSQSDGTCLCWFKGSIHINDTKQTLTYAVQHNRRNFVLLINIRSSVYHYPFHLLHKIRSYYSLALYSVQATGK